MRICTVSIRKPPAPARSYRVRYGLGFQALCAANTTPVEFGCRNADCGTCLYRVISGADNLSPIRGREKDFLRAMRADANERLACQSRIMGDVSIEIPY